MTKHKKIDMNFRPDSYSDEDAILANVKGEYVPCGCVGRDDGELLRPLVHMFSYAKMGLSVGFVHSQGKFD